MSMGIEKPHVFLTGEIQVGKSFLLQRVLRELNLPLSGFVTRWGEVDANGAAELYLREVDGENWAVVAKREPPHSITVYLPMFETVGVACLEQLKGLVVMDELGRFEANAPKFSKRVFEILDSDMPVFGVVRDMDVPFLDAIRNHPKTQVIRVTKDNRDALFFEVKRIIAELV